MTTDASPHASDIAAVQRLEGIDTLLRLLMTVSGLRIALVARVTGESWTCCAVVDEAGFGLGSGDTLDVATTY